MKGEEEDLGRDKHHCLFVYGTLKEGFNNPFATKLRSESSFVGTGYFPGRLYRVDWFPGAVHLPEEKSRVWGEVYHVFDFEKLILQLDEYEEVLDDEVASLYLRRQIPVVLDNGRQLICWTYTYNQPTENLPLIEDGRFENAG